MNKSSTIKELAFALSKAQAEMPPAEMNAINPFLKNKYADLGSVIKTAKPILAKYGLSVSQLPVSNGEMIGVTTILMHDSGEWIESTLTLSIGEEKGKSSAQVAGSIISYLRRYSLSSILGMYSDEDTDGNGEQDKERQSTPHSDRPYSPEVVRDKIIEVSSFPKFENYQASDAQRNLLRYGLELCFAGDKEVEDKRHTVLNFIASTPSTKDVSGSIVKAILDKWLEIKKDNDTGDYSVSDMAIKEAQAIFNASLADEGQQSLL